VKTRLLLLAIVVVALLLALGVADGTIWPDF